MRGALEEIGVIQQVVVNKTTGRMVDGHLRVELAIADKEPTIPVLFVDLTEDEERLALATLDPIGAMAEQSREHLSALLGQIKTGTPDLQPLLDSLAKSAKGLDDAVRTGNTGDDDAPAPKKRAVSRLGDLWLLGPHRLLVGDSTSPEALRALLPEADATLIVTDPPYNVAYRGGTKDKLEIQNDALSAEAFARLLQGAFTAAAGVLAKGGAFYVFHPDTETEAFRAALRLAKLDVHQTLVWAKTSATLTRADYNYRHESILYGWKPGAAHYFAFDFTETTVIDQADDLSKLSRKALEELVRTILRREATTTVVYEAKPTRNADHPTSKPVDLLTRLIANSSRRGARVLDPFGGSGSTLIAAEKLGRLCALIELDPVYADVILRRYHAWAGEEPVLQTSGMAFTAVQRERHAVPKAV